MSRTGLPLPTLITDRCRKLGLSRRELVARCQYTNITKGLRRLEQVYVGELERAGAFLRALPKALELSPEIVQHAIDETVRQVVEEADARWRASFEPSAYLLGTSKVPSQIVFFSISGGAERWLKIRLDLSQQPASYAAQALSVVRRTPFVKFFGPTTGFLVNYTPDYAVRFDCEGRPVETLSSAYRPGEVAVTLGRRPVSPKAFGMAVGTWSADAGRENPDAQE